MKGGLRHLKTHGARSAPFRHLRRGSEAAVPSPPLKAADGPRPRFPPPAARWRHGVSQQGGGGHLESGLPAS